MPKRAAKPPSRQVEPSGLGLRRVKLLEGVPVDALDQLARQCRWQRFEAGRRVISRDAADKDVYLIVAGRVRVAAYSGAGHEVAFRDMSTGGWFGDIAAIDELSRSVDVDAREDTLLASMPPAVFRRLLHEHPAVCDRILLRLVTLIRDLTERVFDFSTLGVQNRVHAELLRLAREAGIEGNIARIDPAPKHSELASKISTVREQVTRELTAMTKQGLLERAGSALVITDTARLERIVTQVRRSA